MVIAIVDPEQLVRRSAPDSLRGTSEKRVERDMLLSDPSALPSAAISSEVWPA